MKMEPRKFHEAKQRKAHYSKSYHPEKEFRFPETMFDNQRQSYQHKLFKKISIVRL